jgi:hypothetical protein
MADDDMEIEEEVALESPSSFEMTTDGEKVTDQHLYADGGDGKEKEATVFNPISGASSAAAASSGIPSALTQRSIHEHRDLREMTAPQDETPMANRTLPEQQDIKP